MYIKTLRYPYCVARIFNYLKAIKVRGFMITRFQFFTNQTFETYSSVYIISRILYKKKTDTFIDYNLI